MTDQQALSRVLRQFARTMANTYDIVEALHDLSENVVEVLEATAAGVGLYDEGRLRFVTATSDAAAEAERLQERLQDGACVEAIALDAPVAVPDLRDQHGRWPEYAPQLEGIGFRAVLGLPLVVDDRKVGSLDVYSTDPRPWDDDVVAAARVLADIGGAFVLNATRLAGHLEAEERLREALSSSFATEQAKGVLAARLDITTTAAWDRIRAAARRDGVTVGDLARRIVESGHTPD